MDALKRLETYPGLWRGAAEIRREAARDCPDPRTQLKHRLLADEYEARARALEAGKD